MRRFVMAAWLAAAGLPLTAMAQATPGEGVSTFAPVEVDAIGHGVNRDAAISNALATALAQETGVSVAQVSVSVTGSGDVAETKSSVSPAPAPTPATSAGAAKPGSAPSEKPAAASEEKPTATSVQTKDHVDAAGQATINATGTTGRIQRYQVLSVEPAKDGGFDAKVHAVLQIGRRQAGVGVTRRRIAVVDFSGDPSELRDKLVMDLTQTRRFAVMDRAHDDAYAQEMAVIQSQGAPAEQARASQALGADYVLTGSIHVVGAQTVGHRASSTSHTIELTGEVVTNHTASTLHVVPGSMEASFQLIEIATRQIVLADQVNLTGNDVDQVAERITGNIVSTIYPPRLISVSDPTALIINQGGEGMHPGQQFKVMKMGEELTDPYTHESLGRTEHEIGRIEITDVQPKISYAKLVSGQVTENPADAMLHPAAPQVVQAAAAVPSTQPVRRKPVRHRAVSAAAPEDSGGFRFGFDR